MDISRCNDQECGFRDNSKISWGGDTLRILKREGHTCSSIYMGIGSWGGGLKLLLSGSEL